MLRDTPRVCCAIDKLREQSLSANFFRIRPEYTGRFSIRHNSKNTSKMELYIEGILSICEYTINHRI
jgi:hypothetical protein